VRRFLSLWIAVTPVAMCLPGGAAGADEGKAGPNVVFILADDLGINDLGCYGRKDHETPRIDRLARQGMRFTSAYAEPVCSPTRAALLTGKAPARLHLTTFLPGRPDTPAQKLLHPKIELQLPLKEKTVAKLLQEASYATACVGKWHLGGAGFGPDKHGFDVVHAGQANTPPSETEGGKGEYDLTRHALQFLDDNKGRPFFLYLAHNTPHIPLGAKPELVKKYRDAFNPTYAAMVNTLDTCVGQVLDRLDELGLADRTLVVFASDNGGLHVLESPDSPATHNTPYRAGKGFLYEGGLRVPLIVRWPGHVAAGQTSDVPVSMADWTPTLLEACGVKAPEKFDGVSLVPLLGGGRLPARSLFWHFPHYTNQGGRPGGAVRDGDWKLIEYYEDGRVELFNLAEDPGEARDLARAEPQRAAELKARLAAWRKEAGAQENEPNPKFDAALHRRLYEDVDASQLKPAATAAAMRPDWEAWRKAMNAVLPPKAEPPRP
jgi:arylsulfatase A-like enzyme